MVLTSHNISAVFTRQVSRAKSTIYRAIIYFLGKIHFPAENKIENVCKVSESKGRKDFLKNKSAMLSSHHQETAAADEEGGCGGDGCDQGCCLHDDIPGERIPELRVHCQICPAFLCQGGRLHTVQLQIYECKPLFMQTDGRIVELFFAHPLRNPGVALGKPEI